MGKINFQISKKYIAAIFVHIVAGIGLFFLLIMTLRSVMNAVNRADFISQRLDDFPRLYENYVSENEEWWNWWITKDYEKRAEQAVFIFENDESHPHESDTQRLNDIAEEFRAKKAIITDKKDYETLRRYNEHKGLHTYSARMSDGRLMCLIYHSSLKDKRMAFVEDAEAFISQLAAGLEGYLLISHDGSFMIYPWDDGSDEVLEMVSGMLETGSIDPQKQADKAERENKSTDIETVLNPNTKYVMYCAAYAGSEDFAINAVRTQNILRFGRKRSWSLWFLSSSILVILCYTLINTKLYFPEADIEGTAYRYLPAYKRGASAMFMAALMLFTCVIFIQLLSSVNQSAQASADEALYLKNVLQMESERADSIISEFDNMYNERVETAASVLSSNPQLIDIDSLHDLDSTLDGASLTVYDPDGKEIASDRALRSDAENTGKENPERMYRAVMTDKSGKTTGLVELGVYSEQFDDLLKETGMKEVIGDLHMLDALHVVVVDDDKKKKIVASTWKSWIGDNTSEHGIASNFFYDGYEGIVNYDGKQCYSVVFHYLDSFVAVGSEPSDGLVFLSGVLLLFVALFVVMMFVGYFPFIKLINEWQKSEEFSDSLSFDNMSEYPQIWRYVKYFMVSVFILSAGLFFTTNGNPTGLTYNVVRGTWVRGISVITATTCIMLVSVVFAFQSIIHLFCVRIERFLSPKGKTICRLLDSGCAYIGAIVMIIYALTMLGVNTTTLIGGVGATALVFTLGANSLIADVLAGIFIIFEGDYTVDDVVVINDFRGIVTDISMRTTKLMDDNSKDIKIIANSTIRELVNQSREQSIVTIDVQFRHDLEVAEGERALKRALKELPKMFPDIIGEPEYWGISKLPELNTYMGVLEGACARIAFYCDENDREMLTYQVQSYLVPLINELGEN